MKKKPNNKSLSEEETIGNGDAYESQLENNSYIDKDGNRYEKNDDGIWCKLVMSKFK